MKEKTPKIQKGKANKKENKKTKEINNALRKFTIVYQNIRGLKSKVDPVQELVDNCQPNLLSLVETHIWRRKKK